MALCFGQTENKISKSLNLPTTKRLGPALEVLIPTRQLGRCSQAIRRLDEPTAIRRLRELPLSDMGCHNIIQDLEWVVNELIVMSILRYQTVISTWLTRLAVRRSFVILASRYTACQRTSPSKKCLRLEVEHNHCTTNIRSRQNERG